MKNDIKIAMLGGDRRQLKVAGLLSEHYCNINIFGIGSEYSDGREEISFCESLEETLSGAKIIILPLPSSTDGFLLNCPLCEKGRQIKLSAISEQAEPHSLIIGGKIPRSFSETATERGFTVEDYFESENFQTKNAYTTAEAAISIAMNSLGKNLRGAKFAITGYGRIAKHLVILLQKLGASVTVAARDGSKLAFAESLGCQTFCLDKEGKNIRELESGYDVIYNTVPTWLFGREFLSRVDRDTVIIDLASAPGGVDIGAARELSSNVSWATSLPGKYAPQSAGALIFECVMRAIERGGGLC